MNPARRVGQVLLLGLLLGGSHAGTLSGQVADARAEIWRGPWHLATGFVDSLADSLSVPATVRASLLLGKPDRAADLLGRYGHLLDAALRLELAAATAAAHTQWRSAAQAFGAAALMRPDHERGLLEARAGMAFEAAGLRDSAAGAYARARARLPMIAGWLALREARLVDHEATAESLLLDVPAAGWPLALQARARLRLLNGEAEAAESLLEAAGFPGRSAELALARGDSAAAIRHAAASMTVIDTADARRGLVLFLEVLDLPTAAVALTAARGAARLGATRQAATWGQRAIALGDSAPATLVAVGGWLEASGQRRAALEPYRLAGAAGVMPHARARLRLGDRSAISVLRRFAADHPEDPAAPAALLLAADALASDSLFREVARRWPRDAQASTARMRLALRRFAAGDSLGALPYLDDEVAHRGASEPRARFLRARVSETRRDQPAARAEFAALAAVDSLGYYGVLARRVAGLPGPTMAVPPPRTPDSTVSDQLNQLALLDSLGFVTEANLVVRSLMERPWGDSDAMLDAMLDAADGLVRLGRANQAIRLGYAAARHRTLHDPRVLRAVFPWPDPELVRAEADAFGLDPFLVAGLIRQESWFLPTARSRSGAIGYMQLMPATAKEVALRARLAWADPMLTMTDANLHLGSAHLAGLLRSFDGETVPALAAYNAGGTPVRRWRRRPGAADPVNFVEHISYPETQAYVQAVVRNAALYRWLYGEDPPDGAP
jgi:soluble lytic murein transglycosylase